MTEFWRWSLTEQARAVLSRDVTPTALTEAALDRIGALDSQIDACVTVMAEEALAAARVATDDVAAGRRRSPLHGLPIGLKDIYDTAGVLTAGGSKTTIDRTPETDASVVAKLRAAGAIPLAKLTTHEFAHGGPSFDLPWPPARNPWNRERFTGGSSSGSGAAVAAGYMGAAMGSDTGGSIRGPAAYCGVAGLKPTYGLVSRAGVIPNSFTFDHAGPLAWTAGDCALMLDAIAGPDAADPASANTPPPHAFTGLNRRLRGLRVGVLRHFWEEDVKIAPEMAAAVENAADALKRMGCVVDTARIAPVQYWYDVKITIAESELFNVHRRNLTTRPRDFGQDFLARSLGALLFTGQDYVAAQRRRRQLMTELKAVYERFDVLLAPSATGPAPRLDAHRTKTFWTNPSLLTPFDVTAGPAVSVNAGFSSAGLPLGVQVVGRPFDDARTLAVAAQLENAIGKKDQRPEIAPGGAPDEATPTLPAPEFNLSAAEQDQIRAIAAAQGFPLDDLTFGLLAEAAPHVWAMARRLDRPYRYSDEPRNVFVHER